MNNIKIKRLMAYLIDILVISLLVSLIASIKGLNPYEEEYKKSYEQYVELSKSLENVTELTKSQTNEYFKIMYDITYYNIPILAIESLVILLYFTLFPTFNNGQTIGKRLFKIKVVSKDGEKVGIKTHLIRSLLVPIWTNIILYTNILNIIIILLAYILKSSTFVYVFSTIEMIICIYCYVDVFMSIKNEDGKMLHDKITKSKVIEIC